MSGIKHNKTRKNERAEHLHALKTSLTEASAHKTAEVCEMGICRIKSTKDDSERSRHNAFRSSAQSREYITIVFCTTLC